MVPTVAFDTLPYWVVSSIRLLGHEGEDGAQVLHIEQQEPLLVRDAEGDVEHALLDVVEIHHPRQQQRAHLRYGGAYRMPLDAEYVPEHDRELVRLIGEAELLGAGDQRVLGLADLGYARQIALDVGSENRHAGARKTLRQNLQRDGLAGAGRARDQAVPVGKREAQGLRLVAAHADEDCAVLVDLSHDLSLRRCRPSFAVRP